MIKKKKSLVAFALDTGSWYQFEERFLEDWELGASLLWSDGSHIPIPTLSITTLGCEAQRG